MKASTKIMKKFTMNKNQVSFEDGLKLTIDWYKNYFLENLKMMISNLLDKYPEKRPKLPSELKKNKKIIFSK